MSRYALFYYAPPCVSQEHHAFCYRNGWLVSSRLQRLGAGKVCAGSSSRVQIPLRSGFATSLFSLRACEPVFIALRSVEIRLSLKRPGRWRTHAPEKNYLRGRLWNEYSCSTLARRMKVTVRGRLSAGRDPREKTSTRKLATLLRRTVGFVLVRQDSRKLMILGVQRLLGGPLSADHSKV